MQRTSRAWAALPLLVALGAGCATTEAPKQAEIRAEVEARATVVAIDRTTRELTLEHPDGERSVVVAGPEVRNFDQIAVGQDVVARYVETLSARVLDPDEADTEPAVGVAEARAELGEAPAGGILGGVALTVRVESVDRDRHIVVFTDPSGELRTVRAQRDEGRRFISGLEPGDRVELVYGEALVLTVE